MTFFPSEGLLFGGLMASSFLLFTAMRCQSLVRWYALTSFFIALWAVSLAYNRGNHELYIYGVVLVLVKVVFIPTLLLRAIRRSGAPLRLQSYLRPASSFFLGVALFVLVFSALRSVTLSSSVLATPMLIMATFIVLLGIIMMVVRRDILSLMLAFLQMENGISLFSMATIGGIPLFVEACIFLVIGISAALLAHLFHHTFTLYGTTDSAALRELID